MKNTYIIFFSLMLLVSCGVKDEEKKYPSGNIEWKKEFDKNGEATKTIIFYDNSNNDTLEVHFHKQNYDSIIYYYKNGKVFAEGLTKKGSRINKWNFYNDKGFLSETKEYMFIKGEHILNQVWYYNKNKDTVFYADKKFNYYNQQDFLAENGDLITDFLYLFYSYGDTVSLNKHYTGVAVHDTPSFEKYNSELYVIIGDFNEDFSNEKEIKLDTFYCLAKDLENRKNLSWLNDKYSVAFGKKYTTSGSKVLRGYAMEYFKRKPTNPNEGEPVEGKKRIYFEKRLYVKEK